MPDLSHLPTLLTLAALVSGLVAMIALSTASLFVILNQRGLARTEKARLFVELYRQYDTPEMHTALYELLEWREAFGSRFDHQFAVEFAKQSELGNRLDRARRTVNRYYTTVAKLRTIGYINQTTASILLNTQGLNVFYEIVMPMNDEKYGRLPASRKLVAVLKKIRPRYLNGGFG